MTGVQMIGLQALLGGLKAAAGQEAGQWVDLGNGYRAFVKTPGAAQFANILAGAAGGGAEGALRKGMREEALADRETEREAEFGRSLDLADYKYGLGEQAAEADQARRNAELEAAFGRNLDLADYKYGLGEQAAEADQARRNAELEAAFGRQKELRAADRGDRIAEALAAAGIGPSSAGGGTAGLDALAAAYKGERDEDAAYRRADALSRLMAQNMTLEQAQALLGVGGGGVSLVNPSTPALDKLRATGNLQDALGAEIEAMKRREAQEKARKKAIEKHKSYDYSRLSMMPQP